MQNHLVLYTVLILRCIHFYFLLLYVLVKRFGETISEVYGPRYWPISPSTGPTDPVWGYLLGEMDSNVQTFSVTSCNKYVVLTVIYKMKHFMILFSFLSLIIFCGAYCPDQCVCDDVALKTICIGTSLEVRYFLSSNIL